MRIDDDDDDDVASIKEPIPVTPEPAELTQKPKRKLNKRKKGKIISPIPNKESTAAGKNLENDEGQITSLDDSPPSTGAGREDYPGTHVHTIILTTSFTSPAWSRLFSW